MKEAFKNAVANIREGMNIKSFSVHSSLAISGVFAGVYAATDYSLAGMATLFMLAASINDYHYDGKQHKAEKEGLDQPQTAPKALPFVRKV